MMHVRFHALCRSLPPDCFRKRTVVAVVLLIHTPVNAWQQPKNSAAETESGLWKEYYQQRAANDYRFVWSQDELPLRLRQQAIVDWTNPLEKGQINGSAFLWEHDGRPVLIGQLFSYLTANGQRSLCHVFTSLTDKRVTGYKNEKVFWQPTPATKSAWHVIAGAPSPSADGWRRLVQMRSLARQFTAYTDEQSRGKRFLRLQSQPLYRSDPTQADFDCGLFAFVVGTDPELLIMIESDMTKSPPVWRYRFAQSTRSTTVALLREEEVYRYASRQKNPQALTAEYLSHHGIESIPGDFDR